MAKSSPLIHPLPPPPIVAQDNVIRGRDQRPLGQILLDDGAVTPENLMKAAMIRRRQDVPLGEILLSHGWVQPAVMARALSRQWRASLVDLVAMPPDPRLIDAVGAEFCLQQGIVPWRRVGGVTYIATSRPEAFQAMIAMAPTDLGACRMLLCSGLDAHEAILRSRRTALIRQAETRVPEQESCRSQNQRRVTLLALLLAAGLVAGLLLAPLVVLGLLTLWATITLIASASLKLLSFRAVLRQARQQRITQQAIASGQQARPEMNAPLPMISMLVPLFGEANIAADLIARLSRIVYPRELMDVLIVLEESDSATCAAFEAADLPGWMRIVRVPDGPVRTKPRAMNYALNFCRGSIVGVWDAEDRPEPDQLHKAARQFHFADPEVACIQGVLDYYNPRSNWLARAFTIEYASWFRATLSGAAALGLVVPLGGTTLFFRRKALEDVGCWDAWNVTEDADLGVRLVRRGYRTEMLDTVTHEEANCRVIPWIKQRSRWHKGFAMTWAVHMRDPRALWRDLGARKFWGFQAQFFAALSQYALAPVLWSFWLLSLGLSHPLHDALAGGAGHVALSALLVVFILSELLNIAIGLWAVRGKDHRHLLAWVPSMHLYFPLGCLAAWKAIYEIVANPFYWDKTSHGIFAACPEMAEEKDATATIQSQELKRAG